MQLRKKSRPFTVIVNMGNGVTRRVIVKAATRQTAEDRALKRTGGISIQRPT